MENYLLRIESRMNSWESLSDVVCAPAVDNPSVYYIYRKNGQEVEVKLSKHAYTNRIELSSTHELTAEERQYIEDIRDKHFLKKI